MALKFAGSDGRGSAEDAAGAIYYAANNGADIVSNSYGYDAPSETLQAAIEYAYGQGVIIVASAGNEGCAKPHYPATYEQVIAVASTTSNDRKRTSSSYGDWVDISAPGVDILSLRAADTDVYGDGEHIVGGDYYVASGTSMACPHVAGVAAMIVSHYPDLSSQDITARLLGTTDEIAEQNPRYANLIGSGRLNANNALTDQEHPAIVFADYDIQEDASGDGNGVWDPGETAHLTVVLKNIWADATDVRGTLWTSGSRVTITDGVSDFGSISSGQEVDNEHDPFEITLGLGVSPYATCELSLTITAAGGYTRQLSFVATAKAQLQDGDWPKHSNGHEPIPYDVDGDGHIELVLRRHRTVEIIKPDGSVTAVLAGSEDYVAGIAVGDIQRDGHVEIVTWRSQEDTAHRYLCLWDKDGQQISPPFYPNPAQWGGTPVLYDLDGDGQLEIIIGGKTADGGEMVVRSIGWQGAGLGTQWQTFLKPLEGCYWISNVAVGDIDGTPDGRPELVFGTGGGSLSDGGQLFALHSDGRIVQGWPVLLAVATERGPVLADLTRDGNLEIVFNTYDSGLDDGLQAWHHTGSLLWARGGRGRSAVIADLDGDGDLEVLTQAKAYHHDGTDTGWTYHVANPKGASVGDLDGDEDMEVLIADSVLSVFHYLGGGFNGIPSAIDPSHSSLRATPVLADLDRDGDIEVITSDGYLAVWDLYGNYNPASIEWSMSRHDPYRTGCYNPRFSLPPVWFVAPEDQVFVRSVPSGFYIQATDPEGKWVTYDIVDRPAGAGYIPYFDRLLFYWEPQAGDSGQEVTFCATDEDGEGVAKTIHIAVVNILIDLDGDGDMDLKDFQRFWGCFLGPDQPLSAPICGQADFDKDGNVDLHDLARLQIEFGALSP
ncbi:MAG: S8 family serine peptidase, partial [Phycisphaerales bacterium]